VFYIRGIFFKLGCGSGSQPHPNLGNVCWDKAADLIETLNDPSTMAKTSEALRGLIEAGRLAAQPAARSTSSDRWNDLVHEKRKRPDASHRVSTVQAPLKSATVVPIWLPKTMAYQRLFISYCFYVMFGRGGKQHSKPCHC